MTKNILRSNNPSLHDPFAEVIESNLHSFTARCWKWDAIPCFADIVTVTTNNITIFGCITEISTKSSDPSRKPYAYQKTEQELLQEQPQIFEMLESLITVQIIAYQSYKQEKIQYLTPPQPCKIHAFVKIVQQETFNKLFQTPNFLHMFFCNQKNIPNLEELLLNTIHKMYVNNLLTKSFLTLFYQNLSLLYGNDYKRSKLLFERIVSLCKTP